MIGFIRDRLRRFRDSEAGSAAVPFALWTPLIVGFALSTIEMGALTLRHVSLERALDQTVREIKLSTGVLYTSDMIKTKICDRAPVLTSCEDMLMLEMLSLDMRDWNAPEEQAQCVDVSNEALPERNFVHGVEHETMMLRACYKYRPLSPTSQLAKGMAKDAEGHIGIVSTAIFVHEPR